MKTANKLLLFVIIGIFASTIIIVFGMGIYLSGNAVPLEKNGNGSVRTIDHTFPLSNYKKVRAGGVWIVDVKKGDEYRLTVTAPENLMEFIKPGIDSEGTLSLDQWFLADPGVIELRASITMPELTELVSEGSSSASFSGFNCKDLRIRIMGTGKITGSYSTIENLKMTGDGMFKLDLGACPAVNADFQLNGNGKAIIYMNGGWLSGKIAGNSEFIYTGTVGNEEISVLNTVKIIKTQVLE
ncbi:MAG: DUF2807 domain-containing protein [Spirochaetales bacterium]|nr:DUF2807 domain-containing protein [Spirochaetales bacterium]